MGDLLREILTYLINNTSFETVNVWNNQFDYIEDGSSYSFAMPCCFIEVLADDTQPIGGKYQGSDLVVNFHIGNDFYNENLMETNLQIFKLRDDLIKSISTFQPSTGSLLNKISEQQDFQHTNVYHYVVSYKMHWIDTTVVPIETFTTPPTTLIINT